MRLTVEDYKKKLDCLKKREKEIPEIIKKIEKTVEEKKTLALDADKERLNHLQLAKKLTRERNRLLRERYKLMRKRRELRNELLDLPRKIKYYERKIKMLEKEKEEGLKEKKIKRRRKGRGIVELGDVI